MAPSSHGSRDGNESRAMRSLMFTGKELEPWERARLEQQRLGSSPIGKDLAREELFGARRTSNPNEVVRAGRTCSDLMPFVDLASPLSLLDANRTMADRAVQIELAAGPKNDGSFAGQLRSPRRVSPRHVSDNSIAPFNDGSAIAEARAVAASIANGRYRTTQTRMVPGRAAPVTEDFTVHDPKKYHPPLPQPTTDVTAGIKQRVPTHPTRAGAEARWGTTEYRRHVTDLRPAKVETLSTALGRQVGEGSEHPVPRDELFPRRRVTDLISEGTNGCAGDGWNPRQHPHDLTYVPPPLRPPPEITADPPPPMVPDHRSAAPWPQHVRRPIYATDATSHADEANRTRNVARSRRQREAQGLPPEVPLLLHEDSLHGHGLHASGREPSGTERYTGVRGYAERYSEVDKGRDGSFIEVRRTGPWVARKPGEVERRPDPGRKTSFELGSDFSRAFQADLAREANGPVHGRTSTSMHGPTSMRRPGLWAKLQQSASTPGLYTGGMSAAAAADETRGGEKELQRARDALKAKIHDKFRTALTAFRSIDTDHSGTLSYDEIVTAVTSAPPPQRGHAHSDAPKATPRPPSPQQRARPVASPRRCRRRAGLTGRLSPCYQVRHFNLPVSDMFVRQLCEAADINGDGHVDYDEFARAVEQMADHGDLIDFTGRETFDDIQGGVKMNIEQKQRHHGSNAEDYQRQYTHQEVHGRTHHVEDV